MMKYVIFTVDDETYSVPVNHVAEIIGLKAITDVPEVPDFIKGIINFRDSGIPVVDLRIKFNKEPREYDDRTAVIIIKFEGIMFGLIVDAVAEVAEVEDAEFDIKTESINVKNAGFLENLGKTDKNKMN